MKGKQYKGEILGDKFSGRHGSISDVSISEKCKHTHTHTHI